MEAKLCHSSFKKGNNAIILQPAPKLLPNSQTASALATPFTLHAPTPPSEPIATEHILSVSEVTTIFIKLVSLLSNQPMARNVMGPLSSSQLRSQTLNIQLSRKQPIRALRFFSYWVKRCSSSSDYSHRSLEFGVLTSKLIVPN